MPDPTGRIDRIRAKAGSKEPGRRHRPRAVPRRPPAAREAGGSPFWCIGATPRCGGQGVYTRHLTRELVALGHSVEVLRRPAVARAGRGRRASRRCRVSTCTGTPTRSGCPTPRVPDRPRTWRSSRSCARPASPSPALFARARRLLAARRDDFDLVHDNQCLGSGLLGMLEDGWPLLTTLHHPITVDRQLALPTPPTPGSGSRPARWFGFLRMQLGVARQLPAIVTVSESSKRGHRRRRWGWRPNA